MRDQRIERCSRLCKESKQSAEHQALGRAARVLRAEAGLSQEELGYRAGLHRNYVGAIERGEINPTFRVLLKLARGLGGPLSELIAVYERKRDAPPSILPSAGADSPDRPRST